MSGATAAAQSSGKPVFHLEDEHPHAEGGSTMLGFWLYLMSDCLIFAMLFACYGVLGGSYAAGPSPKDLFDLPLVAVNTSMLLISSLTNGFAMLAMEKGKVAATQNMLDHQLLHLRRGAGDAMVRDGIEMLGETGPLAVEEDRRVEHGVEAEGRGDLGALLPAVEWHDGEAVAGLEGDARVVQIEGDHGDGPLMV